MFASAKGKKKAGSTAAVVRYSVMIISHITFRDCRVHFFGDNLSRNSCIHMFCSQSMASECIWLNDLKYSMFIYDNCCFLSVYFIQSF